MYILYVFFLLCASMHLSYSGNDAWQEPLQTVDVGGSINLTCLYAEKRITTMIWLRQKLGEKPRVIVTSYQLQAAKFYNEFDKNVRFHAQPGPLSFNLSIRDMTLSDSATYYCAVTFLYDMTFGQGTVVIVKGQTLNSRTLVQQEKVQEVEPGGSVTQCTVVTDRCAGDHSVYWFRHGFSQSGIIYTQEQSSGECEKSLDPGSPTQTCVYSFPKNLSVSDGGTIYCAVAACGEILFGNGSTPNLKETRFQIEVFVLLSVMRTALLGFILTLCALYTCTRL